MLLLLSELMDCSLSVKLEKPSILAFGVFCSRVYDSISVHDICMLYSSLVDTHISIIITLPNIFRI